MTKCAESSAIPYQPQHSSQLLVHTDALQPPLQFFEIRELQPRGRILLPPQQLRQTSLGKRADAAPGPEVDLIRQLADAAAQRSHFAVLEGSTHHVLQRVGDVLREHVAWTFSGLLAVAIEGATKHGLARVDHVDVASQVVQGF